MSTVISCIFLRMLALTQTQGPPWQIPFFASWPLCVCWLQERTPETQQRPLSQSPLHFPCLPLKGGEWGLVCWLDKGLIRQSKTITCRYFLSSICSFNCISKSVWYGWYQQSFINTCTHHVLPKEWYPEQSYQCCQGGSHPRKQLSEATALCAEAGIGSSTNNTMRVTT